MLTRKSFHSATISTIFRDYNSLSRLQSLPFNVNITHKIPKFIGFMNLACKVGHSKEKCTFMHLYTSLGMLPIPKILIKVIWGLPALEVLDFQSSDFLKTLKYNESSSHLQILPRIKVWRWY